MGGECTRSGTGNVGTVPPPTAAIVLAGGSGTRAGTEVNKVYVAVAGRPVLTRALAAPLASPFVVVVALVVRPGDEERAADVAGGDSRIRLVRGGPTRSASELAGLDAVGDLITDGAVTVVAIHDGARPLATPALWEAVVSAAADRGGAVPVLPLPAPVYTLTGGRLRPRTESLVRVQTPQAFLAGPLHAAFRRGAVAGFTGADTAATVERFSDLPIVTVPGDPHNVKVTYREDLALVEEFGMGGEEA